MGTASETKQRKRKLIIYDTLAFLFLAIGAVFFSINHTFAIWGCPLLLIGLVIAAFALRLTLINFGSTHNIATRWGFVIGIPSILLCGLLFCFELKSGQLETKPHFTISLQIGDSTESELLLTNDFLFNRRVVKVGDLPNGKIMANEFVNGCLVIPVQQGESNKVFNFIAENDSPVRVTDLEAFVGFPKEWAGTFDSKWHKVIDESFIIPGWKLAAKNMQYVAAQSPWILYPNDSIDFPTITSPCIPEYVGSTFKGGFVDLNIRSAGFETSLAANIIFVPAAPDLSKPFVTLGHLETNGTLRITPTPEELKAAQ